MAHRERRLDGETESALGGDFERLRKRLTLHGGDFRRGLEQLVTGELAQPLSPADENRRLESFGEEEEEDDEGKGGKPEELKEGPSPVLGFGRKRTDDGCQSRGRDGSDG